MVEAFAWIERDPTVYHTMNGPSEFHVVGSIRDWQSKDRLGAITVPTLLVSGRHDEATPALQETLKAGIAGAEWVVFEESSHMPHVEERERYMQRRRRLARPARLTRRRRYQVPALQADGRRGEHHRDIDERPHAEQRPRALRAAQRAEVDDHAGDAARVGGERVQPGLVERVERQRPRGDRGRSAAAARTAARSRSGRAGPRRARRRRS